MLSLKEIRNHVDYHKIPADTIRTINDYVEKGYHPGGFVTSVLSNNLKMSFSSADVHNRNAMFEIVKYLYNEIPSVAWGSPKEVEEWLESKNNKEEQNA